MSFFVLLKNRLSCSEFVPCKGGGARYLEYGSLRRRRRRQQLTRKNPASVISPRQTTAQTVRWYYGNKRDSSKSCRNSGVGLSETVAKRNIETHVWWCVGVASYCVRIESMSSGLEGDWGAALDQQENELSGKVRRRRDQKCQSENE